MAAAVYRGRVKRYFMHRGCLRSPFYPETIRQSAIRPGEEGARKRKKKENAPPPSSRESGVEAREGAERDLVALAPADTLITHQLRARARAYLLHKYYNRAGSPPDV